MNHSQQLNMHDNRVSSPERVHHESLRWQIQFAVSIQFPGLSSQTHFMHGGFNPHVIHVHRFLVSYHGNGKADLVYIRVRLLKALKGTVQTYFKMKRSLDMSLNM